MFDANLCGVKSGRKVMARFYDTKETNSSSAIDSGIYEAEVLVSGKCGYENALIKVRINDNLTIELKDIDVGSRWVTYEGEVE